MKKNFYFIFIFLSLLFQAASIIFGKFASISIGKFDFYHVAKNPFYLLSLLCLAIQAFFWQIVLRKFPLFYSYLIMSLIYAFILIASYFIFKENISLMNILGTIAIIIGVIIITFNQSEKKNG
ncbi:MAG: hypothetical protein IMZ51_01060 [Chloroflexi bacterium]|nr:hypothetical protein [Chloroflexota bacterium]